MHNQCSIARKKTQEEASESAGFFLLCSGVQHVFDENAVTHGGVIHKHMGHGADELAVLDDGAAGHADVK